MSNKNLVTRVVKALLTKEEFSVHTVLQFYFSWLKLSVGMQPDHKSDKNRREIIAQKEKFAK